MVGKGAGIVGREGVRRGVTGSGWARLAAALALGVVGVGAVGGLSACSSSTASQPTARSTSATSSTSAFDMATATATTTATATATATAAAATTSPVTSSAPLTSTAPATSAATRATSTAPATSTATRATSTSRATGSSPSTLDPTLVGTWDVHDLVVRIGADGTGEMRAWGCFPGTVLVCQVVSDVRVTPFGSSGARLTVTRTYALDQKGRVVPVPAAADLAQEKQRVGDYALLQPFTAATWPYATPLTTASQRAVYSFLRASHGTAPGNPKDELARLCRTTGSNPPLAVDPTYCGA